MKNKVSTFILIVFVSLILGLTIKGVPGNPTPTEIFQNLRGEAKPFELSPERGRYALLTSIVDYKTLYFPLEVAEYVVPDLGYINGKFVSLFAPGVSYMAIPFYLLGKNLNLGQVFAFSLSSLLALLNVYLIYDIVRKLTKNWYAGAISGLVFLFGTSAWPYAMTLYQHHATAMLILLSLRILLSRVNLFTSFLIGSIFALSIFVEYPAALFLVPALIMNVVKHINNKQIGNRLVVSINNFLFLGIIGFILFSIPSLVYNRQVYGNSFQLAGTVERAEEIEIDPLTKRIIPPIEHNDKSALGFFDMNRFPNSLSVLIGSKDRGILWFSPVILLSIFGIGSLSRRNKLFLYITVAGIVVIFLLYGMWGDPWGGWAFGPRYLIPAFAQMAILLGGAVDRYARKLWFIVTFLATLLYSIFVNLAGALTTLQIPPSVEVDAQRFPTFTFIHNFDLILKGTSSSLIYNNYLSQFISLNYYFLFLLILVYSFVLISLLNSMKQSRDQP